MLIVVDANSVAHREKHTMSELSWEDKKVGVIFGFFRQILRLSKIFKSNKFAFCWDSKFSLRRTIYPDYKLNRKKEKTTEEKEFDDIAYNQFDLLKNDILPSIGFNNVFEEDGFESDDIIASIVLSERSLKEKSESVMIVSSDNDMYQLLKEGKTELYDLTKKRVYTERDFKSDYDIEVHEWIGVKALAGCNSDNIKGVKGIGEIMAIKFVKDQLNEKSKAFKEIQSYEGRNVLATNLVLVTLPFPDTPYFPIVEDELNFREFTYMCEKYGFRSFLKKDMLNEWRERFNMKLLPTGRGI